MQVVTSRKLLDNDQEEDVKPKVAQQYEQCAGENYDGPERCAGELECVKCARSVCTSVCVLQVLFYTLGPAHAVRIAISLCIQPLLQMLKVLLALAFPDGGVVLQVLRLLLTLLAFQEGEL